MSGWIIRNWSHIGFVAKALKTIDHDTINQLGLTRQEQDTDMTDQELLINRVIAKFIDGRIKTEKLPDDFFSFKLNDCARVICSTTKHQDADCLVVFQVLPNHKYNSSPYVLGTTKANFEGMAVAASAQDALEVVQTVTPITGATIDGATMVFSHTQGRIVDDSYHASGAHIINGTAGAGKTTASEGLIAVATAAGKSVLYIAASDKLVRSVETKHKHSASIDSVEVQAEDDPTAARAAPKPEVVEAQPVKNDGNAAFRSYQDLAKPIILEKLFEQDGGTKFKAWVCTLGAVASPSVQGATGAANASARSASKPKAKQAASSQKKASRDNGLPDAVQQLIDGSYQEDLLQNIRTLYKDGELIKATITDMRGKKNEKDVTKAELGVYQQLLSFYLEQKIVDEHGFVQWFSKCKIAKDPQYKARSNNDFYDLYQDMCKAAVNGKVGRKQVCGTFEQQQLNEILNTYKDYLRYVGSVDLAIATNTVSASDKYDVVIVDESHDLTHTQLEYTMAHMNKDGVIYFLRDGNQSLADTFNLTRQYIIALASQYGIKVHSYELEYSYRMPERIVGFIQKLVNIKAQAIGGKLEASKSVKGAEEVGAASSSDDEEEFASTAQTKGYIGFVDSKDASHQERLDLLKTEAKNIVDVVVVIPDESLRQGATQDFPEAIVLTPKQVKGLEYKKVVLYNFISGDYRANYFKDGEAFKWYDADAPVPKHFPVDKKRTKYALPFTKLFVAVTRTTSDVIFVESSGAAGAEQFKTIFEGDINQGAEVKLEAVTFDALVSKILKDSPKMDTDVLLKYMKAACAKVNEEYAKHEQITLVDAKKIATQLDALHKELEKRKSDSAVEIQNDIRLLHDRSLKMVVGKLVDMGCKLFAQGKYDEAMLYFNETLKTDHENVDTLLHKGVILVYKNKADEAMRCFDMVLNIDPQHVVALTNKACVLTSQALYAQAIQCCDEALKIDPQNVNALTNKGHALMGQGEFAKAIQCCDEALKIDHQHINALTNKGIALRRQGEFAKAIQCCNAVLERDPENIPAQNLVAKMVQQLPQSQGVQQSDSSVSTLTAEQMQKLTEDITRLCLRNDIAAIDALIDGATKNYGVVERIHFIKTLLLSRDPYAGGFTTTYLYSLAKHSSQVAAKLIKATATDDVIPEDVTRALFAIVQQPFPGTSALFYMLLKSQNKPEVLECLKMLPKTPEFMTLTEKALFAVSDGKSAVAKLMEHQKTMGTVDMIALMDAISIGDPKTLGKVLCMKQSANNSLLYYFAIAVVISPEGQKSFCKMIKVAAFDPETLGAILYKQVSGNSLLSLVLTQFSIDNGATALDAVHKMMSAAQYDAIEVGKVLCAKERENKPSLLSLLFEKYCADDTQKVCNVASLLNDLIDNHKVQFEQESLHSSCILDCMVPYTETGASSKSAVAKLFASFLSCAKEKWMPRYGDMIARMEEIYSNSVDLDTQGDVVHNLGDAGSHHDAA